MSTVLYDYNLGGLVVSCLFSLSVSTVRKGKEKGFSSSHQSAGGIRIPSNIVCLFSCVSLSLFLRLVGSGRYLVLWVARSSWWPGEWTGAGKARQGKAGGQVNVLTRDIKETRMRSMMLMMQWNGNGNGKHDMMLPSTLDFLLASVGCGLS
ncbi:hypothetical protein VTJ04DRAFT_8614 [Mycothermus thermophilus]|uniref:uncharacterized protein n=1 Tax=Humicola insolens TaxID=85995 RepID=UPI00374380FE